MESVAGRELRTERWFPVPPERVFDGFRNPAQLARWWGPAGFRNTFSRFEFREGGPWEFVMHGPNGVDYPNMSMFRKIVAPTAIVIDHVSSPRFQLNISLQVENGGVRLVWRQIFETAALRDQIARVAKDANEQNLDRLEAELPGRKEGR
ncbi:MAG: SRPBCC domain-containing protein [Elusimicrobia bacterium]|nr:SRPBCC domain-containing protein [Elusimicrobiota bacterium]